MKEMIQAEIQKAMNAVSPLRKKYAEFNQPRSSIQLRAFVVGQHETPMRQMHQCLLEIAIKDRAIRRTQITRQQMRRKLQSNDGSQDDRALLEIDLEETDEALLGAVRELQALVAIYKSFECEFTYEAWMAEELEYWKGRITAQARRSINATGTIGVGDQASLEQLGISPGPLIAEGQACLRQHMKNLEASES